MRIILFVIAIAYALNGAFMLFQPQVWYEVTPGVSMLGPYNTHFIRDVSLVYLVTAAAFVWGARPGRSAALLVAAAWPALHAIYHLQMWVARGLPFDLVALVNITGIQAPAWAGLFAAWRLHQRDRATS